MTLLDPALHRRYAELWLECERLADEYAARRRELQNLGEVISSQLVGEGLLGLPFEVGDRAFRSYLHTSMTVRRNAGVTAEGAIAALGAGGLAWMIAPSYSSARLSAWAKEELAEHRDLPAPILGAFHVHVEEELRLQGAIKKRSLAARAAEYFRRQSTRPSKPEEPKDTKP